MTRSTALALMVRLDIDRELLAAGRPLTEIDRRQVEEIWDAVFVEDVLAGDRRLVDAITEYGGRS